MNLFDKGIIYLFIYISAFIIMNHLTNTTWSLEHTITGFGLVIGWI